MREEPQETLVRHEEWLSSSYERFEKLVNGAHGSWENSPYAKGSWSAAYTLSPPAEEITVNEVQCKLNELQPKDDWPLNLVQSEEHDQPYCHHEILEVWLGQRYETPHRADFWRLSPTGQFIIFQGYTDDDPWWRETRQRKSKGPRKLEESFDYLGPIRCLGELLGLAKKSVDCFSLSPDFLSITAEWTGLKGRHLVVSDTNIVPPEAKGARIAAQNTVEVKDIIRVDECEVQRVDCVRHLLQPLLETFGGFSVTRERVKSELSKL